MIMMLLAGATAMVPAVVLAVKLGPARFRCSQL